jgi:hypothetical protein
MGAPHEMYGMPQINSFQNYNNVAAASFYSHLPFGSSAYMNGFGGGGSLMPQNRHPMDMMGYGSYSGGFN